MKAKLDSIVATTAENDMSDTRVTILVISASSNTITDVENGLMECQFKILIASDSKQALYLFKHHHINHVFIDIEAIDIPGDELVRKLRIHAGNHFIPIIILADVEKEKLLADCISAGSDDFLYMPFNSTALKARISSLEQVSELRQLYKNNVDEQVLAKQILTFALSSRSLEFDDIKLLNQATGIFSGDIFLTSRRADGGLHILMADFTGHGLSAAIGALPVADIFSAMTEKGFELNDILENINDKLHTLLPISMFMACSILKIHHDLKYVDIWNGGMPDIYIKDCQTGKIKNKLKSMHIPLGIDETISNRFNIEKISLSKNDQLILYTDGLTEALNVNDEMFGEDRLEKCIVNSGSHLSVFNSIAQEFKRFCGKIIPYDDVTLACIPCTPKLVEMDKALSNEEKIVSNRKDDWCWYMELSGSSLRNVNPVPIVISEMHKISGQNISEEKLSSVLNVLYKNAILHGVQVDYEDELGNIISAKSNSDIKAIDNGYLRIGLKQVQHKGESALLVSVEDSGQGFNHIDFMRQLTSNSQENSNKDNNNKEKNPHEGISLVYELSESLHYLGRGNRVEAIISDYL